MRTYSPPSEIEKERRIIDAGLVSAATIVANYLRGKHKLTFTAHGLRR